ncbi:MAG: hypothetical protein ACI9UD_001647 [Glaciecola sp.]
MVVNDSGVVGNHSDILFPFKVNHADVAPGADLIDYGSGAALLIIDSIGGFDYALTHQFQYNIRVISNSFGSTSDIGTDFNPDDLINIATKDLADNGIITVFPSIEYHVVIQKIRSYLNTKNDEVVALIPPQSRVPDQISLFE